MEELLSGLCPQVRDGHVGRALRGSPGGIHFTLGMLRSWSRDDATEVSAVLKDILRRPPTIEDVDDWVHILHMASKKVRTADRAFAITFDRVFEAEAEAPHWGEISGGD